MVLMLSWTALYAQTGNTVITPEGDTLTYYTNSELKKIATRIVRANECDTLYNICEQQLSLKDSALHAKDSALVAKDSVIANQNSIISLKEDIITGKDKEIDRINLHLDKAQRREKWLKVGWGTTSVVFTGLLIWVATSN